MTASNTHVRFSSDRKPLCAILCTLALVLLGGTLGAAEKKAPAAPATPAGEPSAHNPCFDQPGLWPADVKKTDYYKQKWAPARLLVFAQKGPDWSDPANWLEDGKPATKGPDKNTDLLFPDGDYKVFKGEERDWGSWSTIDARHLTIGKGVEILLRSFEVTGNVWAREGVKWRIIECQWKGGANTFSRNDMGRWTELKIPEVNKTDNASVEVLGLWGNHDGLYVNSGKLIIGPDSIWYGGDRHQNTIGLKGSLILMSGSKFQTYMNKIRAMDLDVYGELLVGTSERPIDKDVTFALSYKSRGRDMSHGQLAGDARDYGLVVRPMARLAVTSADPKKARLNFTWWTPWREEKHNPQTPGLVHMALLGKADLNGVHFNGFAQGGIELADPTGPTTWKNISFGKDNAGKKPEEIFTTFSGQVHGEQPVFK